VNGYRCAVYGYVNGRRADGARTSRHADEAHRAGARTNGRRRWVSDGDTQRGRRVHGLANNHAGTAGSSVSAFRSLAGAGAVSYPFACHLACMIRQNRRHRRNRRHRHPRIPAAEAQANGNAKPNAAKDGEHPRTPFVESATKRKREKAATSRTKLESRRKNARYVQDQSTTTRRPYGQTATLY
jgi:hypothetical protein